jgi:hypothetical protein
MIISLTKQEVASLINIMDKVDGNGSNELKEMLKDNKIVTYSVKITGDVEVIVDSRYMLDFLNVYEKFIGLFVNQAKALYETTCLFQKEAEQVINKYIKED